MKQGCSLHTLTTHLNSPINAALLLLVGWEQGSDEATCSLVVILRTVTCDYVILTNSLTLIPICIHIHVITHRFITIQSPESPFLQHVTDPNTLAYVMLTHTFTFSLYIYVIVILSLFLEIDYISFRLIFTYLLITFC